MNTVHVYSSGSEWLISALRPRRSLVHGQSKKGMMANRERNWEADRNSECVHSWPYPVDCGLRKASVGATCVGGVS